MAIATAGLSLADPPAATSPASTRDMSTARPPSPRQWQTGLEEVRAQLELIANSKTGTPFAPPAEVDRFLYLYNALGPKDKEVVVADIATAYAAPRPKSLPQGRPSSPETIAAFFSPYSGVRYEKVWYSMSIADGAIGALVDIRGVASKLQRHSPPSDVSLRNLTDSLRRHLVPIFNSSALHFQPITWDSPARILERVMHHEAVHPMKGWDDVKQRVGGFGDGRIVLGFFHEGMKDDVVAFVEIGFFEEVRGDVTAIINDPAPVLPTHPSTAIFYSITSPHPGLTGIDMGHMLIKRCVPYLFSNYRITTFCTLSPIPGFRAWFEARVKAGEVSGDGVEQGWRLTQAQLDRLLGSEGWIEDAQLVEEVRLPVTRWCARYLVNERKGAHGQAIDPVANFHLRNGSCLHRINWMGNVTSRGLRESLGIMVNYNYLVPYLEPNHLQYLKEGVITVTDHMSSVLTDLGVAVGGDNAKVRVVESQ
ncbi:MCD-domain-containing protein [Gonapodya prolifera JEL478]|uniref:MCD-domain-containing protein n=1 Tax=Gonapodya prolifera (strain JEL478) TaxID=1344416 RepID=A0A139AN56_GONPJ|nr:MCD-domain-containing protein [Gonapodya prolifera JEL478]|eukprot:KXS18044.1 MCD-domain-containing protein [Gonapodya prolifera JEL478]